MLAVAETPVVRLLKEKGKVLDSFKIPVIAIIRISVIALILSII